MPMYEYACQSCDHAFETLVFGDEKVVCPKCESDRLARLLSLPSVGAGEAASNGGCGDLSLPPCGAPWCQRQGR